MTLSEQFETFWRAYPRRVGKGAARKSFERAIRLTTLPTMLKAIEDYQRCKPAYQDFCHPSTWLNQERWDDEWTLPEKPQRDKSVSDVLGEISAGVWAGDRTHEPDIFTIDTSYSRRN